MPFIRVFQGGEKAEQAESFIAALNEARTEIISTHDKIWVERLTVSMVKSYLWTPENLVNKLLEGDAHFITAHVHQGKSLNNCGQLGWNMADLESQLQRLYNHPGFPNGIQLSCPVFLQDKGEYLMNVPEYCNPTFLYYFTDNTANSKLTR